MFQAFKIVFNVTDDNFYHFVKIISNLVNNSIRDGFLDRLQKVALSTFEFISTNNFLLYL